MPRTVGKTTHLIKDIYIAYAKKLLAENPDWYSRYGTTNSISHDTIYKTEHGKRVVVTTYQRFRRQVEYYLDGAKKAIIRGEAVNMLADVGKIVATRVERDFRKKKQRQVDWNKSIKLSGEWSEEKKRMVPKKLVFYTSSDWSRIAWKKTPRLANIACYEFTPAHRNSAGTSGFKLEFSEAQVKDPNLKYSYLYVPIIIKKKKSTRK